MAKGLLGKKLGMMNLWDAQGRYVAATALQCGPCPVVQIKSLEKDGYQAVQIGFGPIREKLLSKAEKGHQAKVFSKIGYYLRHLVELRDFPEPVELGTLLDVTIFKEGDKVSVTGVSKGKGFQGVVKRHGFGGGRASHGSTFHRAPGSIGAGTDPSEVVKGKRMPGRMGGRKTTIRNLTVMKVIPEDHVILVKGAVPGPNGSLVLVHQK